MKILPEHYEVLEKHIAKVVTACPNWRDHMTNNGLSMDRMRWDLLYIGSIGKMVASAWICKYLYPYLNDSHITTALRRIIPI